MCPDPECHDPCFEGPFLLALHAFHERSLMSGAKRFCEAVQLDKWVEKRKVNRKNKWNLVKDKRKPRREKSGNHSRNTKPDSPIRMTTASTSQNLQRRAQTTLSVKLHCFWSLFYWFSPSTKVPQLQVMKPSAHSLYTLHLLHCCSASPREEEAVWMESKHKRFILYLVLQVECHRVPGPVSPLP